MKRTLFKTIMALAVFFAPFYGALKAQQLAFPGAEGFGKYAIGGRNGTVVHVTNLNDAGAGSLRDAVSVSNRIVVFDVAGVIRINARIVVSPNITLAGQTAPGEGITVYGNGWSFSGANNSICRYMKIRMGEVGSSGNDANGIANGHDMIFDHCSISWGRDETFSINAPTTARVTIQNTAMTQGLLTHSAGGLIQNDSGITLYRNLYADNGTRNNKIKGRNQYVNNIVYNWSAGAYIMGGDSEGESFANAVSNLFIQGPIPGTRPFSVGNNKYHIYATDNLHDSDHNGIFNPYVIQQSEFGGGPDFQSAPYPYPILPTVAANTLLDQSLPTVGASLPYRDFVDYYVVNEVKSLGLRGQFIGNETALPFGVPTTWYLWPGTKRTDTDNDGMPDDWETSHNLNPNSAADAMVIASNGYANIENYINGIDASYSQYYLRAPLNLVKDSATQNSISLSWYDYTDKEQGYIVEQKINGVFTQIGTTGVNGNTFTVKGLQPEEKDTFRVKAFNGSDFSAYSNILAAKSDPIPVLVLNPATFVPDLVWTGAVSTNWDKVTNNWTNSNSIAAKFVDSAKLKFNTLPTAQTINLAAQMGAKDMLFQTDVDYLIQGAGNIAGSGSINKYGAGKLSLLSNNTYTGATVMAGGTLEINKIANGGLPSSIGASLPYAFNWVWKGGLINYTGGKTSTDRNISLDATTEFSVASAAAADTMYGVIAGSGGLTKSGLGNLVLRNINPYLGETVIKKGTLEVIPISTATDAQNIIIGGVALGTSNVLRLQGGTFKTSGGSTVANEDYPMHMYIEGSDTSGFTPYRNADISGSVSGSGTLLYTIPYLREIIKGDWSEYTGTLIAYGSNTTDGSILMIDNGGNGDGFPNARVVATGNTKICTYSNNLTVSLGGLSSDVTGVKLSCGGTKTTTFGFGLTTYSVGGANTDETFRGVINNELYGSATANDGSTTIIKEGDGLWRLTNTNTYSGTTTIIGGKLIVNGSHTGSGAFTVTTGTLAGTGSIAADVDVADTLQPGDNTTDLFTLKGKLTLEASSTTQVDINKTNNTKDTIAVTGAITYGGTLQVNFTGTPAEGDVFKLFNVGSTQSGTFSAIVPATPGQGLQWLFKPATGELLVVSPGFVQAPSNLALTATSDINTNTSIVSLTWTDNSDNELYFILERSTDGINFTDINHPVAGAVAYQDKNLIPNTTYYYRIKAVGSTKMSTYSNIASIKTPSIFSAPDVVSNPNPTNAAVDVPLANGGLNLTWSGSNNTVSYAVYFGTVAGSLTKLADVPYSANPSYQVTGLTNYSTYYWRIDATNATGTTTGTQWSFRTAQTAPVAGDYRSAASGGWGTVATWQTFDGANWIAATVIPGGSVPTITIRNGHSVLLNATTAVNNVIVEPTATLKSDGTARNLRVIKSIISYGIFGGTTAAGDRVNFEGYVDNGTITLGGTTTYFINTFGVNPLAVNVNVVIDANLNVNGYFHAYYSNGTTAGQDDDNITITLNEGRTVTMGSGSSLHETSSGSTNTTNTISTFGNYTYNFNGVFDMRASTSNTSSVVAHSTKANSHITFNINGTWYTGGAMRLVSNITTTALPAGSIAFNIGDKGIVDARGNGTTNTNIVTSNSANGQVLFFNITGNGVEKYRVGASNVTYAIGTNGSYSPVILNNSGTTDLIAVGVKNTFDGPLNDATKLVKKQYTITPATVGAANLTVSLGWLASDQTNSFSTTTDVIGIYNGSSWDETPATVSGAGTINNPYYAKASGFTSFSPFGVGNANAFAKLAPVAFTGCPNVNLVVARPGYNAYNNEPLSIYTLDTATGTTTLIPGGPLKEGGKNIELNGAGVNGLDNFLYGIRDTINTAGTAQAAMLYRIGGNYGNDMLGTLPAPAVANGENLTVVNPSAGTFDDQGNYYYIAIGGAYSFTQNSFTPSSYYVGKIANVAALTAGTGALTATFTKIDFSSAPAAYKSSIYSLITSASGTGAGKSFQDLAYSNLYRSLYVYAAYSTGAAYAGQLLAINPTTGVATFYANPPAFGSVNNEVAGISTTASGNLRVLMTSGDIYKPVMAGSDFTSTLTKVGTTGITSVGSIRGDLASCGVGLATLPTTRAFVPPFISVGSANGITAYPNPAQGLTTITVGQRLLNATVKLLDLAGNVIAEKSGVAGYTFQMDMTGKPGGLYTIEVIQGGNIQQLKLVKP